MSFVASPGFVEDFKKNASYMDCVWGHENPDFLFPDLSAIDPNLYTSTGFYTPYSIPAIGVVQLVSVALRNAFFKAFESRVAVQKTEESVSVCIDLKAEQEIPNYLCLSPLYAPVKNGIVKMKVPRAELREIQFKLEDTNPFIERADLVFEATFLKGTFIGRDPVRKEPSLELGQKAGQKLKVLIRSGSTGARVQYLKFEFDPSTSGQKAELQLKFQNQQEPALPPAFTIPYEELERNGQVVYLNTLLSAPQSDSITD